MSKLVVFDIDGTLFDSSKGIKKAINYTINQLNLKKLSEKELDEFVGFSPLQKAFIHYCNVENELSLTCCDVYRKNYKEESMFYTEIYNGIIPLLEFLKNKNFKLGIATFKNEENAKLLLEHLCLDKYFDCICGAKYGSKETKTDILNNCVIKLNIKWENTIFIGDSKSDAIAAINNNCNFIGVTYGFGFKTEKDLEEYKPIFIAKSPNEIQEFFENTKVLL